MLNMGRANIEPQIVVDRKFSFHSNPCFHMIHKKQGHFLGLYHTFSTSCNLTIARNGDFVDDTPYHLEKATTVNCKTKPSTWDTCPDLPGQDPVDNFMSKFHKMPSKNSMFRRKEIYEEISFIQFLSYLKPYLQCFPFVILTFIRTN